MPNVCPLLVETSVNIARYVERNVREKREHEHWCFARVDVAIAHGRGLLSNCSLGLRVSFNFGSEAPELRCLPQPQGPVRQAIAMLQLPPGGHSLRCAL